MTNDEALKYIADNQELIGEEYESGFVCGSLWILPTEPKALNNCLRYYATHYVSEAALLPVGYDGEVGVVAVDVRYLRRGGLFLYKILAE